MTENKRFELGDFDSVCEMLELLNTQRLVVSDMEKENEELKQENKTLKEENKHYKYILQDLGLLMSDEEVRDIRIEIADKIINPLCKENGFDVDVDCTNGFTIIPKR